MQNNYSIIYPLWAAIKRRSRIVGKLNYQHLSNLTTCFMTHQGSWKYGKIDIYEIKVFGVVLLLVFSCYPAIKVMKFRNDFSNECALWKWVVSPMLLNHSPINIIWWFLLSLFWGHSARCLHFVLFCHITFRFAKMKQYMSLFDFHQQSSSPSTIFTANLQSLYFISSISLF